MCGAGDEAKKHYLRPSESESDAGKPCFYPHRSGTSAVFPQIVAIEKFILLSQIDLLFLRSNWRLQV